MTTIILLALSVLFVQTIVASDESYNVRGTIKYTTKNQDEPFEAWYDHQNQRSRIDFHNGKVKTYYLPAEGDFGKWFVIRTLPEKDDMCLLFNGTEKNPISAQSVFPNISDYDKDGTESCGDAQCAKWTHLEQIDAEDEHEHYEFSYIALSRALVSDQLSESNLAQFNVQRSLNPGIGVYDTYTIEYDEYVEGPIADEIFNFERVDCFSNTWAASFRNAFDPFEELIHPANDSYDEEWLAFTQAFKGKELKGTRHDIFRKHRFIDNVRYISSFNRAGRSTTLAINRFADIDLRKHVVGSITFDDNDE